VRTVTTHGREENSLKITTIHFIRHGKVENPEHVVYERLDGYGLSELGRNQARATGRYVANDELMSQAVAVFSSPLQRTRETAGIVADALNGYRAEAGKGPLEIQLDDRLLEIENHFKGKNIKREALLPQNWRYFKDLRRPSYGESYQSVAERMSSFLYEKVDEYAGQTILAVSHEGPIWALRCLLVNGTPQHWLWDRNVPHTSVMTASIDVASHRVLSVSYANPAGDVKNTSFEGARNE
jgi:broad specificity phosphatase PhoE